MRSPVLFASSHSSILLLISINFLFLNLPLGINAEEEENGPNEDLPSAALPIGDDGGEEGGAIEEEDVVPSATPATVGSSTPSPPASSISRLQQQDHRVQQLFSLSKKFQLVCCMGGVPQLSHPELVRNFTFQSVSYVVDRDGEGGILEPAGCRLFKGSFLLPQPSLLFGVSVELSYAAHVICKCPEIGMGHALDRSCRRLPNCQNNGFRSLLDPRRCFCLEPFFGERCEKLCDRGRRMRGPDGRDYCSCAPFYSGDECRDVVCINGGRPLSDGTGCQCPQYFLGYHCEIDANRTGQSPSAIASAGAARHEFVGSSSRFHQRFGPEQSSGEMFSRDVSGTVFSLVMIVVLVLSMYLLMKHRMQVQTRYLSNRRADLLGACNFPGSSTMAIDNNGHLSAAAATNVGTNTSAAAALSAALFPPGQARRVELLPFGGEQPPSRFPPFVRSLAPFFSSDSGPPPYAPPGQRVRRSRNEVLPPLPSYEDATKLPALRTAAFVMEQEEAPPPAMPQSQQEQPADRGEEAPPQSERFEEGRGGGQQQQQQQQQSRRMMRHEADEVDATTEQMELVQLEERRPAAESIEEAPKLEEEEEEENENSGQEANGRRASVE